MVFQNLNIATKANVTSGNNRFKKLRGEVLILLHHFLLNLVRADKFLQVKPQILKPAKRYLQV